MTIQEGWWQFHRWSPKKGRDICGNADSLPHNDREEEEYGGEHKGKIFFINNAGQKISLIWIFCM